MSKKLRTEDFIRRSREAHGNRYDYSQSQYVDATTKIKIICPLHGEFWQKPINHMLGCGCKRCGIISGHNLQRDNKESFIAKAKAIHGDTYDYNSVKYVHSSAKVDICCKIHGIYRQRPADHLSGHGCLKCKMAAFGKAHTKTTSSFIANARKIHGDVYDYSLLEYIGTKEKVKIICPEHGEFWQTPNTHLRGAGCPKCALESKKSIVHGIGINDCLNASKSKAYRIWIGMLERCYSKHQSTKWPSYNGCSVCDDWLYFSNFKRWFDQHYVEGYALDKDILFKGNQVYSPNTCCFVPKEINTIIINRKAERGTQPLGVTKSNCGFEAAVCKKGKQIYIGVYPTAESAFLAYKLEKESHLKKVATEYFDAGKISRRVFEALTNYTIDITD